MNGKALTGLIITLVLAAWSGIIFLGLNKADAEDVKQQQQLLDRLIEIAKEDRARDCMERKTPQERDSCLDRVYPPSKEVE